MKPPCVVRGSRGRPRRGRARHKRWRSKSTPPNWTTWSTWQAKWSSPNRWSATTKICPQVKSQRLQRKIAQLTRITAELQKTAMAMRLVPIGPLFRRMARLVRDLSRQFGKRVEMETLGGDIELDRTIVEELADPLMHMVRNALDHGIETPAGARGARESPRRPACCLRRTIRRGQVVIEIADDGRGLDRARIQAKAIESGLISSARGLSDTEIYNLIFQPGFSTAAQVTNVSGRGVGMDVVRQHIRKAARADRDPLDCRARARRSL